MRRRKQEEEEKKEGKNKEKEKGGGGEKEGEKRRRKRRRRKNGRRRRGRRKGGGGGGGGEKRMRRRKQEEKEEEETKNKKEKEKEKEKEDKKKKHRSCKFTVRPKQTIEHMTMISGGANRKTSLSQWLHFNRLSIAHACPISNCHKRVRGNQATAVRYSLRTITTQRRRQGKSRKITLHYPCERHENKLGD
jgi:hypothetical protein